MAAAYAAQERGGGGAGGVLGGCAGPRRARGSAALPARGARGRAARARARTRRSRSSASACGARSASSPPPRRGEETLYAGDGAVCERIAAVLKELEPLAGARSGARARGRAAARGGGDDRGRGAQSRTLRPRRPLRSGAARRGRGAAVPAAAPLPQARRHGRRIWPRGARRSPPSWARSAPTRRGWRRGRRALDEASRARAGGGRRAHRRPPSGRRQPRTQGDATLRELGFSSARLPVELEARELGPRRRRPGALPVRAQSRGPAPAAGQDRLGRRAVAGHAGGQAGAGADGRGAHLRLRRGRRRAWAAAPPR